MTFEVFVCASLTSANFAESFRDSGDSRAPGSPDHLATLRAPIDQDSSSISGALSTLECLEPTEIAGQCRSSGTKNDNRIIQVPTASPTMTVTEGSSA